MRIEENKKKEKNTIKKKLNRKKCIKKTKLAMPRFEPTPLNNVLKQNVKVTKTSKVCNILFGILVSQTIYDYCSSIYINETQSKCDHAVNNP